MIVALTGGIGCGKSTALSLFSELGWSVLDADKICHKLYDTNSEYLKKEFDSRWGVAVVDGVNGTIDRSKIAEIVFSDKKELDWLNNIFHPLIWNFAMAEHDHSDFVMFDIPLLFEAGWNSSFNSIISVWACKDLQYQRLVERGLSNPEISSRIYSQMSNDSKLENSDFGIINCSTINFLKEQCIYINNQLRTI